MLHEIAHYVTHEGFGISRAKIEDIKAATEIYKRGTKATNGEWDMTGLADFDSLESGIEKYSKNWANFPSGTDVV